LNKKQKRERYKSKYNKVGLMRDIKKYEKSEMEERESIEAKEQLAYVLPNESLYLMLGEEKRLLKEMYPLETEYEYAYSRYFWEAYPKLPEITIEEIKELLKK